MRVLLTGSTGWLGRYLAPMLRAGGHDVTGLDVAPGPDTQVVGSVADRALLERTMLSHGIEGVIHAAALHKPDIVRYPRQSFIDVNLTGTLNLLEEAVAAGVERFVFTSTTSLMITQAIRDETASEAVWLDEDSGPLLPRNIYGVTKRAAEEACRLIHAETGLPIIVLRTARFFPEDDDTHRDLAGENMKANEFLNRRLTVQDCAAAHIAALEQEPTVGFGTYLVSAPTPFRRADAAELKRDARSDRALLPRCGGPVCSAGLAPAREHRPGLRCRTDRARSWFPLRDRFRDDPLRTARRRAAAARPRCRLCLARAKTWFLSDNRD